MGARRVGGAIESQAGAKLFGAQTRAAPSLTLPTRGRELKVAPKGIPTKSRAMTDRLKRLKYRAHYRGTREADAMIGGFFDAHSASWNEAEIAWFEALVDQEDDDIMAWALGRANPPAELADPALMTALRQLDYITQP